MQRGRDPRKTQNTLIDTAFKLYSEKTIESVTYQEISNTCGISMATIFRHYPHKQDLVIAVGTKMWQRVWGDVEMVRPTEDLPKLKAVQRLEFFMDFIISLYQLDPRVLRFNAGFDSYARREQLSAEQLKGYYDAVEPLRERFHWLYERAKVDHTMRTDIPEEQLFFATLYAMLSTAGRMASVPVWPVRTEEDCMQALKQVKAMIMQYCTQNCD